MLYTLVIKTLKVGYVATDDYLSTEIMIGKLHLFGG